MQCGVCPKSIFNLFNQQNTTQKMLVKSTPGSTLKKYFNFPRNLEVFVAAIWLILKALSESKKQPLTIYMQSLFWKKILNNNEIFFLLVFFYFFFCTIPNITAMYINFFFYISLYMLCTSLYIRPIFLNKRMIKLFVIILQRIAIIFLHYEREREKHIYVNEWQF